MAVDEITPLLIGNLPIDSEPVRKITQPLVDFDPVIDEDNPLDWPRAYKNGVVALLAFMAFTISFTCIGVVPVASQIVLSLSGKESKSASILLVTVWELGEAIGPLIIAPLSEIYGRYSVFVVANFVLIGGIGLGALSESVELFIFSRFLMGCAVAGNVLGPAIIGDVFRSEERGTGMSMVMLAPLLGGAIGPAISGAIASSIGWHYILYLSFFIAVIAQACFLLYLRETYKPTILQRRSAFLRHETGDSSYRCAYEPSKEHYWSALSTSIKRPVAMLVDSRVLKITTVYGALVFTFYYVLATTFPGILGDTYGFSPARTGSSFLSFSAGATVGIVICSIFLDKTYISLSKSRGVANPEYRLLFAIFGALFLPFVVALYGWIPYVHLPVSLLLIIVTLLGILTILISISLSSYIVDTFGLYSASAMTMVLVARCVGGTLLPLAIPPLTDALGLGPGFVVLAGVCAVLIPAPIVVMRYGVKWRQLSMYTRED